MRDFTREELEEAVELVRIALERRREIRGIHLRRSLQRAHLHLQPVSVPLNLPEHPDRVAVVEPAVQELHVLPDARLDAACRVDEVEREVGRARSRTQPTFARRGEHALDDAVLDELRNRRHAGESTSAGRFAGMADVQPFLAIRYRHPTADLVAPPYDVLTAAQRDEYAARSPHNVVHLTLNDSEDEAGRLFRTWLEEGVLAADDTPAAWVVAQDYIGPDGIARRREGIVASLGVEPYTTRAVLPHERTHRGPKKSRLRLLRAARAQLEPIFLLYDGAPPLAAPSRPPDLAAAGTSLWRVDGATLRAFFADRQLLIADGHHRYETAVAYAAEATTPGGARMMVVLVSTEDPGLEIFPTHRVFTGRPDIAVKGVALAAVDEALVRLATEPYDRAVAVAVTGDGATLVQGEEGELDVELVDRFGHDGISYTPDRAVALDAVERGAADVAFLLRATRIEDVFSRARRGEVMPQKTTYFFPKLTSGLLFHPV